MTEISLSGVTKTYRPGLFKKNVDAVSQLTFDVLRGEVFGLIGPNGAGKSTTIRMILGLIRPDRGTVSVMGQSYLSSNIKKKIGYLPENPYLYDHLTLLELLSFCGQTVGLSRAQIDRRGQELMAKLNLLDAQKRPLRTFSKGMLQRAGICFALIHNPSIIIFDEPMSGLDPVGRKMVFDLVMELKEQDKTIFFCSHILNDVERLCDRIALMNRGKLVKEFRQEDFGADTSKAVYIKTQSLSEDQIIQIEKRGGSIREDAGGHLVGIKDHLYFTLNRYFEESGVIVQGCRSEWMTLEDMFMETVKAQQNG